MVILLIPLVPAISNARSIIADFPLLFFCLFLLFQPTGFFTELSFEVLQVRQFYLFAHTFWNGNQPKKQKIKHFPEKRDAAYVI